ncbi:MAG TPA: L-glutamate gamma-semialdehyde dehydrogenase [Flavobacteriales bacterium]|jgi:1-pyrroline-5-carboxylate dehydrogenase|nr:L-glutamate gamma-semialdehyde dehydrogenase [Flavobacteriales bacterium]HIB77286.1 L-glutamate gamma-semialdehyde dehydrogenase [Flavobacteriales bacterium]HIO16804.1 L-glutamate gamma-semialdehyde dehydrogenase [Flavobacteriales bacterium]
MANGTFQVPFPVNEPVLSYAPGSPEREELQAMYEKMYNQAPIDVPMYIGSELVRTSDKRPMTPPHEHGKVLGHYNFGDASHVESAISAALKARTAWAKFSFVDRATIFLKAADLIAGKYRAKLNAATMLSQGKNCFQAEIDASCELIDFLRFNAYFAQEIQQVQPESSEGVWNRTEYRALEGFTFALTPFNFTAIAANLPAAMAMMGNVVVWKPASTQVYSAQVLMEIFREAGVPDGVINLITLSGSVVGDIVFKHPDFSGLHFTGSTGVFRQLWKAIGANLENYKTYPRIVGETGGKDFVVAHSSANTAAVATGLLRGAFEYQGQKCSAASRAYISDNIWEDVKSKLVEDMATLKMGSPADFSNFINAVIDRKSFDNIAGYIDWAKGDDDCEIIAGGNYDDSTGYFIEPTVIVTSNPMSKTMVEEIFGPVLTIYVFKADEFEATLELVDSTSEYALTGAVFAQDRYALSLAKDKLENAAGNFYLNDKPTGAVVGQQPFGGARGSGTNDKAGSALNLLRWVSPRTIKETLVPVEDYRYPFHS